MIWDLRCFLSCTQPRLECLITKKSSINLPINAFVIKDLIFLCVYFGLEAILVVVFLKRVGLINIHQNVLGVTTCGKKGKEPLL